MNPTTLPVISLWRPWTSFFFKENVPDDHRWGPKEVENRNKRLPARLQGCWVALHSAKKYDKLAAEMLAKAGLNVYSNESCPTGIIGLVKFNGWTQYNDNPTHAHGMCSEERCSEIRESAWFSGPYGWIVEPGGAVLLPRPLPVLGKQTIGWPASQLVIETIAAQTMHYVVKRNGKPWLTHGEKYVTPRMAQHVVMMSGESKAKLSEFTFWAVNPFGTEVQVEVK